MKRLLLENYMTGWRYMLKTKACAQLCHKFCTILDYCKRKVHVKMYERFIKELKLYSKAIRVLSKGYLPISLLPPSKLEKILKEVRIAIAKSNKDYGLVLTRLYLYYDMKLVTFGIDNHRNLIVQFPVFVQPYTQKRLIMYQIKTVPVPILDGRDVSAQQPSSPLVEGD